MKVKHLLATGGVAAALALGGASVAFASPDRDCSSFPTPVKIVNHYDPNNLDRDGDGVDCEMNAGDATAYDLYADLKGEGDANPQPSLAETGVGPAEHPVRWLAGSVTGVVVGTAMFLFGRSRKSV